MTLLEQISYPRRLCAVFSFCIRVKSRGFDAFLDRAWDRQTREATSAAFQGGTIEHEGWAQATP